MSSEKRWEKIRKAKTYREFLAAYLAEFGFSLSDFARASGFGRGFPGDILSGKRRLTAKSSFAFEKALKLPLPGRKLFRFLVASEEPDLYPELDRDKLVVEMAQLRAKDWKRTRHSVHEGTLPKIQNQLLDKKVLATYAAAGTPVSGAALVDIQKRTGFAADQVLKFVKELESLRLLEFTSETQVLPKDQHVYLQTTDQSALLNHTFRQSARIAVERISQQRQLQDEFFFNSSFCVRLDQLAEFKKELRETVLKFVDNATAEEGNRVVHLLTALHL